MNSQKQFHPLFWLSLIYICFGVITRSILWGIYAQAKDVEVSVSTFLSILPVGVFNDAIVFFYFTVVVLVGLTLLPARMLASKFFHIVRTVLIIALIYGMIFVSMAEVTFFDEFESRFNLIAVSYLIYPTEVIGNIKESYPLSVLLTVNALVAGAVSYLFRKKLQLSIVPLIESFCNRATLAAVGLVFAGVLGCSVETNTLYRSSNRIADELAANGISSFFRAFKNMDLDFHTYYVTLPSEVYASSLRKQLTLDGSTFISEDPTDLHRAYKNNEPLSREKKLNVVILAQESLGAEFVESLGGKKGLTPFLDSLGKESLSFTNAFATGTRTVRGLEAISSSFPPIPSESIVKRPGSEDIATIGSVLRSNGYSTSFLYGGYGVFDNMNHFFSSNGFEIYDHADMTEVKFSNIWGASDEDLYRSAISYFREKNSRQEPFFGLVMSTSNHKPYTFPPNDAGIVASGGGRDAGVRYADYSIKKFFEQAKKEPWFNDTIFLVIADHDARVYGKTYIPVQRYRIPAIFYAPNYIMPEVNARLFSQLDVVPTLLGMLGISYNAPFYGQNVLTQEYKKNVSQRWIPLNYNFNVALYNQQRLITLGINKVLKSFDCHPLSTGSQAEIAQTSTPTEKEEEQLLIGYYQSAFEAFTNKKYRFDSPHAQQ